MPNDVIEKPGKLENVEGIIDALKDKDDDIKDEELVLPDAKDEDHDEDDEEDDKEDKDDKKDELTDDEDDEELLEEDKYIDIPSRKVILKAFPDLFKKFPGVEHSLYREKAFTEIFVDPKEAQSAKEELAELKNFEERVVSGSLEEVLQTVKQNNQEGFNKIAATYLQSLAKVDERAYYNAIGHVISTTIYSMFMNGREMGGEDGEQLQIAAQLLNKYYTGKHDIRPPTRQEVPKENEDLKKLQEERTKFIEAKLNDAIEDVTNRTENIIKSIVDRNIDTKEEMSSYVRNKAIDDVMNDLDEIIENDARFRTALDNLWKKASESNFSKASKDKIRNLLLTKSKSVLPDIIRRRRADALKGLGKVVRESKSESNKANDERPERKTSSNRDREPEKPNRRLSTLDYLNKD